jgi:hypothetical protein
LKTKGCGVIWYIKFTYLVHKIYLFGTYFLHIWYVKRIDIRTKLLYDEYIKHIRRLKHGE